MRHWNAKHGGILLDQSAYIQPNPYLQLPERDPVTVSGRHLTTLDPGYMMRELAGEIRESTDIAIRLISLNPLNPLNRPDDWEARALREFEKGEPLEKNEFMLHKGQTVNRFIAALSVQA
jgi:hypothetical protein